MLKVLFMISILSAINRDGGGERHALSIDFLSRSVNGKSEIREHLTNFNLGLPVLVCTTGRFDVGFSHVRARLPASYLPAR